MKITKRKKNIYILHCSREHYNERGANMQRRKQLHSHNIHSKCLKYKSLRFAIFQLNLNLSKFLSYYLE